MKLIAFAAFLMIAMPSSVAAQTPPPTRPFVSKACGFRLTLPADWIAKVSRSKKCAFTFGAASRLDEGVELTVRDGTLEEGAEDLGFKKDNGEWMLQGEDYTEATQIDNANWAGLQGRAASRIYGKKGYEGLGDQARAVLFDRSHRIVEVTCFADTVIPGCLQGFEFMNQPGPK
jgi:hypothetical protein